MRKMTSMLVAASLAASILAPTALAEDRASVALTLNGTAVSGSPFIDAATGRTMAPVRYIAEGLGAKVEWDPSHNAVLINMGASLPPGLMARAVTQVWVSGQALQLDTAPVNIDGRFYVPVRAVAEALKAQVTWQADTRTVEIVDQTRAGVATMLTEITRIEESISANQPEQAAQHADALEEAWAGFEDEVKAKDRDLYGQIEEPLDGIVAGSKVSPLDAKVLGDMLKQLTGLLGELNK